MQSLHGSRPESDRVVGAHRVVERSVSTLANFLVEIERLTETLTACARTLERPEAMIAADGAASFLALAADALRDGSVRLADLEDADLIEELATLAAEARVRPP
jgi:hypothetical protein